MFKTIHGIALIYPLDPIVINFYVNGYDNRGSDMDLYLPILCKEAYQNSFMYMGDKLWNDLSSYKILWISNHLNKIDKHITSSLQNQHLCFLAIDQFPYEVMIISLLPDNSTF